MLKAGSGQPDNHLVVGAPTTSQQATIAAVWEQHRPAMVERVQLLERAQTDPTLRADAREAAHQLVGTAGTFGFPNASELARKCEMLLMDSAAAAQGMTEWVAAIRAEIADSSSTAPAAESTEDLRPTPLPVVLVVTDDPGKAERLRAEAGRRGLRVAVARIAQARARLDGETPDAVLVDLSAPGADALLGVHPTTLALASDDRYRDRLDVARRGAIGFLEPAITPADAIDQVTLALQRHAAAGDRVLVVNADGDGLAAAGLEIVSLTAGVDVWEELNRVNPSTIVLGPAELELCRVIRNDARWSIVPIVVIDEGDPASAFAAGADDVAQPAQLESRVRNHLVRYRIHRSLADTDPLTGLRNRRTGSAALSHLIRLAERLERPLCVVEVDIDHFKRVNDTRGHMAGDAVLRRLGELLKRNFRGEDVVARWGGEEFVVGLFGLDREGGIDRVSDLLGRFRAETFTDANGDEFQLTFSAGVAQYPIDGADLESLYGAADEALYAAKRSGRDQVTGVGSGPHATQQVDVAIIEDEDAISELIAHTLSGRGLRCFRFSNGAGAVQMLLGERPRVRARVILLDLNLPAVHGMELLILFEREGVLRSSRTIVVSAEDDPDTMERARSLGAISYIVKPVGLEALAAEVETALGRV